MSSPKLALTHTKLAFEQFVNLGDKEGELKALNTLGIIHGDSGNLPEALKTFLALIALCDDLGDQKGAADALNNAGLVHLYMGGPCNCTLTIIYRPSSAFELLNVRKGKFKPCSISGVVNYELGRYTEALDYFSRAEALEKPTDEGADALILTKCGAQPSEIGEFPPGT